MVLWLAQQAITTKIRVWFPGGQNVHGPIIFDIVNFRYELMIGKTEGLFAVLVVWSVSYASVKNLECEGSIYSFSFYGKWPTIISLIHPKDELSFKEMRMWGQSKISSCFICDWCESREMGGRQSPRLPTPVVENSPQTFFQL